MNFDVYIHNHYYYQILYEKTRKLSINVTQRINYFRKFELIIEFSTL